MEDFDRQPSLAPPFIIFEDIYIMLKRGWKSCCRKEAEDCKKLTYKSDISFQIGTLFPVDMYMEEANEVLSIFERSVMLTFLSEQERTREESTNNKISEIDKR